jgi:hypothetical protein
MALFELETNCAWAGIRTSNLVEEPYRAQSDASAFLAMDPSFFRTQIQAGVKNNDHQLIAGKTKII